jgi:hypothetical protein
LARTGYARIALREAIAYASIGEPEHACSVARASLPTLARQGSASLRGDLRRLTRALNRYRNVAVVTDLLPDLASWRAYGGRSDSTTRRIADPKPGNDLTP